MTSEIGFDRLVEAWFAEDAAAPPPAFLSEAVADATRLRRPRRRWHARLRMAWAGDAPVSRTGMSGRGLLALAGATLIGTSIVGGALLAGSSSRAPTDPTWSFVLPVSTCDTVAPVPGAVPAMARAPLEHPSNGWITVGGDHGVFLLDPATGEEVAAPTFVDRSGTPFAEDGAFIGDWSPDGRWLALRLTTSGCTGVVLVAADGSRAIGVSPYQATVAWSPDGRWLATANGPSVDVIGIAADGSVSEVRRVWNGADKGAGDLAWGPDGTLAISVQGDDLDAIDLMRPGDEQAVELVPGLGVMAPLAWSRDGTTLITAADTDVGASVFAIAPVTGRPTAISGPQRVRGGKYLDVPMATGRDRVYFASAGSVWSVATDGTDLRQVTPKSPSMAPDIVAVSPDGRSIAFTDPRGLWLTGIDGGSPSRLRSGPSSLVDWQPIP